MILPRLLSWSVNSLPTQTPRKFSQQFLSNHYLLRKAEFLGKNFTPFLLYIHATGLHMSAVDSVTFVGWVEERNKSSGILWSSENQQVKAFEMEYYNHQRKLTYFSISPISFPQQKSPEFCWMGWQQLNWANTSQEKSLSALSPALLEKLTISQLHQPAQLPACLCAPHMDKGRSQLFLPFPLQATYWHLCWFTDSKGSVGESHNSLQLPRIAELRRHWESPSHTFVQAASYNPVSMYVQKTERLSHFQGKKKDSTWKISQLLLLPKQNNSN